MHAIPGNKSTAARALVLFKFELDIAYMSTDGAGQYAIAQPQRSV